MAITLTFDSYAEMVAYCMTVARAHGPVLSDNNTFPWSSNRNSPVGEAGKKLKEWRILHGWSAVRLANALGYRASSSVSHLENGVLRPGRKRRNMVESLTGIPADSWATLSDDTCRLPGAIPLAGGRWKGFARINGKPTHLGTHATMEEAHAAVLRARKLAEPKTD